jgi:hypothetical protein
MVPTYTRGSADVGPVGAGEIVVTAGSRGGDLNASPFLFTFRGSAMGTPAVRSGTILSPRLGRRIDSFAAAVVFLAGLRR